MIAPLILLEHVLSDDDNEQRFILFVPEGIDIRDDKGVLVASRKPIASGDTKTETLLLASIILSMSEMPDLQPFLEHWEEMTGLSVEAALTASHAEVAGSSLD